MTHVPRLTRQLQELLAVQRVSLLVVQPVASGEPVHALARVTFDGRALVLDPGTEPWRSCRDAYLERFPEAGFMTQLGDFRFVAIEPAGARQVAGFGAARSIDAAEVRLALQTPAG